MLFPTKNTKNPYIHLFSYSFLTKSGVLIPQAWQIVSPATISIITTIWT